MVSEFKKYRRKHIAELRPYVPGEDLSGVSISAPDKEGGSPKVGDMIARNPKNHKDQWLVAEQYFKDNFEPVEAAARVRAEANAEPVAWRYKLFEGDPEWTVTTEKPKGAVVEPLFTRPSEQAVTEADKSDDAVADLFLAAWAEADKAMRKFPQPNYVISKVAEEAGEVVKAAIHCAEGRETPENVVAEIKQAMAMLIRLYVEGDQVHGLPALKAQEDEK